MCGWRRDFPGWIPGFSRFAALCRAAGADASRPPTVWELFMEEELTTSSIFPSSLMSRVRMSSSNTAIVLFRSAVRVQDRKKGRKRINQCLRMLFVATMKFNFQAGKVLCVESTVILHSISEFFINAYHNLPWRFPAAHLVHSGSLLSALWHIAGLAPVSAHATQHCSDGEAAAQCSAGA